MLVVVDLIHTHCHTGLLLMSSNSSYMHHSVIYLQQHFILIWVALDPNNIQGIPGTKQRHTLDRMPVHCKVPYIHSFKHSFPPRGNLVSSNHQKVVGENQRTQWKPTWTWGEHVKLCTGSGSNWGLWRCQTTLLSAAPPREPVKIITHSTTYQWVFISRNPKHFRLKCSYKVQGWGKVFS